MCYLHWKNEFYSFFSKLISSTQCKLWASLLKYIYLTSWFQRDSVNSNKERSKKFSSTKKRKGKTQEKSQLSFTVNKFDKLLWFASVSFSLFLEWENIFFLQRRNIAVNSTGKKSISKPSLVAQVRVKEVFLFLVWNMSYLPFILMINYRQSIESK